VGLTERQLEILTSFGHTGSCSETGRCLRISRQRVSWIVVRYKSRKLKGDMSDYYSDRGCPDGEYPSCLGCPLSRCKYDRIKKKGGDQ